MEVQSNNASMFRGGFSDPVFNAQSVFRRVMDALARPGSVVRFDDLTSPPAPLLPTVGSIAATLFDHDTRIWLDPALSRNGEVAGWLTFNTSAQLTLQSYDADFAVVADLESLPSLESFSQGTQEYPDRSTTLILQIDGLMGGRKLHLSGPGIEDVAAVAPKGLPEHFFDQWASNGARFPRGADVLLAAPEGIIGLPRTAKISLSGG
ncbi:phosphonate C-P lyase system protein PhnH [Hoeflea sp. TYP-13]|uniref:phosphonate C-P lyase system protein PhnH n=1 Tax=Hoeflea sp. TYP-13 TaxID=3230023 RepID=UPI0034C6A366